MVLHPRYTLFYDERLQSTLRWVFAKNFLICNAILQRGPRRRTVYQNKKYFFASLATLLFIKGNCNFQMQLSRSLGN